MARERDRSDRSGPRRPARSTQGSRDDRPGAGRGGRPVRAAGGRGPVAPEGAQGGADGSARGPTDPRVCRQCGERVLDIKSHLARAHPRRPGGGSASLLRLDPGAEDAVREMSRLLEDARAEVFKEPLKATALIDRARDWTAWLRDRTRSRPSPRSRSALPPAGGGARPGRRLLMGTPGAAGAAPDPGARGSGSGGGDGESGGGVDGV